MRRALPIALAALLAAGCGSDEETNEGNDWTAYIAGGTDYDLKGGAVSIETVGEHTHIDGADTDGHTLVIIIEEKTLTTRDYSPFLFNIVIAPGSNPTYLCDGPDVTISVQNVGPLDGTFQGPVNCSAEGDGGQMFSGFVDGTFTETF